jgi:hypothetical protein
MITASILNDDNYEKSNVDCMPDDGDSRIGTGELGG